MLDALDFADKWDTLLGLDGSIEISVPTGSSGCCWISSSSIDGTSSPPPDSAEALDGVLLGDLAKATAAASDLADLDDLDLFDASDALDALD